MSEMSRTLQIVSIQHELAMSIGLDLNLDNMLRLFLDRAKKRLSLRSAVVFKEAPRSKNDSDLLCYPYDHRLDDTNDWLSEQVYDFIQRELTNICRQRGDNFYYFFKIPKFGAISFERKFTPIDDIVVNALLPLFRRLAVSCQACLEHQNLVDEISNRKAVEEQLRMQTYQDVLTGLPNRKMLNINLQSLLTNAEDHGQYGAVFFIDLDRFKLINDTLGHSVGDELLINITSKLKGCVRRDDTLARVGGDEFILLLSDIGPTEQSAVAKATKVAEKMLGITRDSIELAHCAVFTSFSIGIALFPSPELNVKKTIAEQAKQLVKHADVAMYKIKHTSRNGYLFYRQELQIMSAFRSEVEQRLHVALREDAFELYFQPMVNVAGEVVAAEALLRWHDAKLGWVGPQDFIPVAEECGLIMDIGQWVLRQTCELITQHLDWFEQGTLRYISINISPRQFSQPHFVEQLLEIIEEFSFPHSYLRLEITEGVAMENITSAINIMKALIAHELFFMLDDFGSGYSSLSYLHSLPLKSVKIDRSFVSKIDQSTDNQVIVEAIIYISQHFSLECVVEGLETPEEYAYFHKKDVAAIQGFHFYKPLSRVGLVNTLE
ncbi:EAL domain-containing protein [Paraglaciecola chathamensis]|uniref:putative bifunctional diguanylate cyclase/phosphodiesterase n=1 Tax=Paraglaciecola chathamensis TaxID=368405 RepID=UPI00270A3A49|nr:EAL domain-containing protein [Paraglaciecola chathamensis]MDO6841888.1 EAL domain-containing protein [Paraglaciecola chathamensis]